MSLLNEILAVCNLTMVICGLIMLRSLKKRSETIKLVNACGLSLNLPRKIFLILGDVAAELEHADKKYPHDRMVERKVGLLTIKCELTELEREVERSNELLRPKDMRKEAVQVAAMAVKFLRDICK
jgi:hypothetical protein